MFDKTSENILLKTISPLLPQCSNILQWYEDCLVSETLNLSQFPISQCALMTLCQMQNLKIKGENSLLTLLQQTCLSDKWDHCRYGGCLVPIVSHVLFWSAAKGYRVTRIENTYSFLELQWNANENSWDFGDSTWIFINFHCFMIPLLGRDLWISFCWLYLTSILTLQRSRGQQLKREITF